MNLKIPWGRARGSRKRGRRRHRPLPSPPPACQKAGIEDFTFHGQRHNDINNWRLQGNDYFRIMKATGPKTMSVFQRNNPVSREELKALVIDKV